jgi:hypothetical protein
MVQNGLMTRNEARRWEGLPPAEGADELTVQLNLTNIATLNAAPDTVQTNAVNPNGG